MQSAACLLPTAPGAAAAPDAQGAASALGSSRLLSTSPELFRAFLSATCCPFSSWSRRCDQREVISAATGANPAVGPASGLLHRILGAWIYQPLRAGTPLLFPVMGTPLNATAIAQAAKGCVQVLNACLSVPHSLLGSMCSKEIEMESFTSLLT